MQRKAAEPGGHRMKEINATNLVNPILYAENTDRCLGG